MKTMQRLRHVRQPKPDQKPCFEQQEELSMSRRERLLWQKRAIRFGLPLLALLLVVFLVRWFNALYLVTDGLVMTNPVVVTAPARVRITQIHCGAGDSCAKNQPLLRLEAVGRQEERSALELAVKKCRLRLALVAAGGKLEATDLSRRGDLVATARRESQMRLADYQVQDAKLTNLMREKELLRVDLAQQQELATGKVAVLKERLSQALALVREGEAENRLAGFAAEAESRLQEKGLLPKSAAVKANTAHQAAWSKMESLKAGVRALRLEVAQATRNSSLEHDRRQASLAACEGQIETARRQLAAIQLERDQWQAIHTRRKKLFPGKTEGANLVALERQLLATEVATAEMELRKFDREYGNLVVRAECAGVIDRLAVAPGAVVEAGTVLLTYCDPQKQWVTAYATPKMAGSKLVGRRCHLVPEDGRAQQEGLVVAAGLTWVTCPEDLKKWTHDQADLRIPVRIEYLELQGNRPFRPRTRVKVIFGGPPP